MIRKAVLEDAKAIVDINIKTWHTTYSDILDPSILDSREDDLNDRIKRVENAILKGELSSYLVLEENHEIIGFSSFGPCRETGKDLIGEIYAIYILEEYQNQGFGKQLILESARWLYQKKYDKLIIYALKDNNNCQFYEKIGGLPNRFKNIEILGFSYKEVGYSFDLETLITDLLPSYHIKTDEISLNAYQKILIGTNLVKSRMLLKDNISEQFKKLENQGIDTLTELIDALKSKKKLMSFSLKSGINENYLTVLIREIRSNLPKPIRLDQFTLVDDYLFSQFKAHKLLTTKDLFDQIHLVGIQNVSEALNLPKEIIETFYQLSSLVRIRWVNHTFAEVLLKLNMHSVDQIANADPIQLHKDILCLNDIEEIYKAHIGQNDIKILIGAAQLLKGRT